MPYIAPGERSALEARPPRTAGELNYAITKMCHEYLSHRGISYSSLNDVVGVLECAKQELYRKVIAGYEDSKIAANGSVSSLDK